MIDMKKCEKIQEWIIDSLLNELDIDKEKLLQKHLVECKNCKNEYQELRKFFDLTTESLLSHKYYWNDKTIGKKFTTTIDIDCLNAAFNEEKRNITKRNYRFAWRYGLPIAASLAILAVSLDAVIKKYREQNNKNIMISSVNLGAKQNIPVASMAALNSQKKQNIIAETMVSIDGFDLKNLDDNQLLLIVKAINSQLRDNNSVKLALLRTPSKAVMSSCGNIASCKGDRKGISQSVALVSVDEKRESKKYSATPKVLAKNKMHCKTVKIARQEVQKNKPPQNLKIQRTIRSNQMQKVSLLELLKILEKNSIRWSYDPSQNKVILFYEK